LILVGDLFGLVALGEDNASGGSEISLECVLNLLLYKHLMTLVHEAFLDALL
jgi:hypothetical protein